MALHIPMGGYGTLSELYATVRVLMYIYIYNGLAGVAHADFSNMVFENVDVRVCHQHATY